MQRKQSFRFYRSEHQLRELCRGTPTFLRPDCIDSELLKRAIAVASRRSNERELQDRMLRQGANYPIMQSFFGWTANQKASRRQMLGLVPNHGGRPVLHEPEGLYEAWQRFRHEPDLKIRLLRTAEYLDVPLRNIHANCMEYLRLEESQEQNRKQRAR